MSEEKEEWAVGGDVLELEEARWWRREEARCPANVAELGDDVHDALDSVSSDGSEYRRAMNAYLRGWFRRKRRRARNQTAAAAAAAAAGDDGASRNQNAGGTAAVGAGDVWIAGMVEMMQGYVRDLLYFLHEGWTLGATEEQRLEPAEGFFGRRHLWWVEGATDILFVVVVRRYLRVCWYEKQFVGLDLGKLMGRYVGITGLGGLIRFDWRTLASLGLREVVTGDGCVINVKKQWEATCVMDFSWDPNKMTDDGKGGLVKRGSALYWNRDGHARYRAKGCPLFMGLDRVLGIMLLCFVRTQTPVTADVFCEVLETFLEVRRGLIGSLRE